MNDGGFIVKFSNKKKPERCYSVAFDYDEWSYAVNNNKKQVIPKGAKKITIETTQK